MTEVAERDNLSVIPFSVLLNDLPNNKVGKREPVKAEYLLYTDELAIYETSRFAAQQISARFQ